ncbi:MAG: hypothetical protein MI807_18380, partial [Verrucomicrobiales bacterium]|nr:hypothetical protein [Verrucomicrobiales bacterium]
DAADHVLANAATCTLRIRRCKAVERWRVAERRVEPGADATGHVLANAATCTPVAAAAKRWWGGRSRSDGRSRMPMLQATFLRTRLHALL